jgi:hypothetical protein
MVNAGVDKPPDSGCLCGRDDPGPERHRIFRERRDDEEHAVDSVQRGAQAGRVTQVARHSLIGPGLLDLVLFLRIVHERPHLDTCGHQGRHNQAGELSRRADG